jgi:predicted ATP-dependent endonuclease of OLD family
LEEKPAVVFMDEPEISLHIGWQQQLLDVLTSLNSNAQFFITTH